MNENEKSIIPGPWAYEMARRSFKGIMYKYCPISSHTERVITSQSLYFSDPFAFNDPFECRYYFKRISRSALKQYVNRQGFTKEQKSRYLEGYKSMTDTEWHQFFEGVRRTILKEDGIGICCLSATPVNIPMWSYYAQDHKGVCFEFSSNMDADGLFHAIPYRVTYTNDLLIPVKDIFIQGPELEEEFEKEFQVMLTKSKQWEHEEEVRLIGLSNSSAKEVAYHKEALRSIIFGCRATQETIDHYKGLLKDHRFNHVKLKQAEKDVRQYKLNIVDL